MERKEVVVARKLFHLGLKGLDDAITEGKRSEHTIELEVGPTVFQVEISWPERAFILHWCGMTNLQNIIWMRFVALELRWPPVRTLSCFTFASEDL